MGGPPRSAQLLKGVLHIVGNKIWILRGVVVQVYNFNMVGAGAEVGGLQVPGKPGLHGMTLFQTNNKQEKQQKNK